MNISTYFRRFAKYVIYLTVFLALILSVMNLLNATSLSFENLFQTERSYYLLIVVGVFALIYPFMGYTKKTLTFNANQRVDEVVNVMAQCGYGRVEGNEGELTFKAIGALKRLSLMYEDTIIITTDSDDISVISGPRKEVVKAAFKMTTFIS